MHNFSCTDPEDMVNEAALDDARETARRMIKDGEIPLDKIARYVPALSMDVPFALLLQIPPRLENAAGLYS